MRGTYLCNCDCDHVRKREGECVLTYLPYPEFNDFKLSACIIAETARKIDSEYRMCDGSVGERDREERCGPYRAGRR